MTLKEKAAGVLATPATAIKKQRTAILQITLFGGNWSGRIALLVMIAPALWRAL